MQVLRNAVSGVAFLLFASTAFGSEIRADGAAVIVNGVSVFRLVTGLGAPTPAQRATELAAKLGTLAFWGQSAVRNQGSNRVIVVSGEPVLTLTPQEASEQKEGIDELAKDWANRLRDAMSLPPLKVSDNFVKLPPGGSEVVRIMGSDSARASISAPSPEVARVVRNGSSFRVVAKSFGHETISVTAGKSMENIDVQVLPFAASFPQTITVSVTGAPATQCTVQGAAEGALRTRIDAAPGAHLSFGKLDTFALATGDSKTYSVHAWAAGPDAYSSQGRVDVVVKNLALATCPDENLWYSNNPETVRQPGSLFSSELKVGSSARLLYHHMNGTQQDIFIRVEAVNRSSKPAEVEIIPGDSRPCQDPVRAGVAAAEQFLKNWTSGSGEIVMLPPETVMPISIRRLSPGDVASGLCSIRLVSGSDDLLVRADAFPPLPLDDKWRNAIFSSTPWQEVGTHTINTWDQVPCEASPQIYPKPYKELSVDYQVGGPDASMRIGAKGIEREDSNGVLNGNFGVIYNLKANLKNPTDAPADIELSCEASGGYAGGLFLINGNTVKTPFLQPKGTTSLGKFHLDPGASQSLAITTLPLSGSSYPITLTLRPAGAAAPGVAMNPKRGPK